MVVLKTIKNDVELYVIIMSRTIFMNRYECMSE